MTILVTVRERQHLDLRGTGWALVGRIPGSIPGACLVALLSKGGLAWVVVVVVLSGLVLAVRGWAPKPVRLNLIAASAASGASWAPRHPSEDRPWPWSGKAIRDRGCGAP
ncbi:hypothetical protein [Arthrobacter sp. ISL-5]|uniref:hypothetical protein n=1 Tax=Arthrobacter sp. ISL-5 TaxID=2819111 RepID=UPI002034B453|nr:hypothetical protein [Arthrobacter sp. ISL-5]